MPPPALPPLPHPPAPGRTSDAPGRRPRTGPVPAVSAAVTDRGPRPRGLPGGAVAVTLLLLTAVAACLRLPGLGSLGFIVDEGYQALAVRGVLEHGLPRLDTGYVYTRAFPFVYLQAACAWLLGFDEFALRLPAAVFGVLLVPVGFWFGRALFNTRVGLVTAALLALSAWEVEYARYARFYSLFQCLYLAGLVAFYRGFVEPPAGPDGLSSDRAHRWRVAFGVLFVATILIHHLGLMLILGFAAFLPLRGYPWRQRVGGLLLVGVGGALWAGYIKADDVVTEALNTSPPPARVAGGLVDAGPRATEGLAGLLQKVADVLPSVHLVPPRFVPVAFEHHRGAVVVAAGLTLLVAVVAAALLLRSTRSAGGPGAGGVRRGGAWTALRVVLLVGAVAAAALHLLALAGLLLMAYAAWFVRTRRELLSPPLLLTAGWTAVATVLWVGWFRLSPHASLTAGLEGLLSLPDLHRYFFQWMVAGWPVMLVLLLPAAFWLARAATAGGWNHDRMNAAWFLLASFVLPAVLTAQLAWKFSESRYFLHLYPLLLTGLAVPLVALTERWARRWGGAGRPGWSAGVLIAATAGLAVLLGDTDPREAAAVTTRGYASDRDPIRAVLNYRWHADFHHDQQSIGEAVRAELSERDVVVAVGPPHQAAVFKHYAGRVDYVATSRAPYDTLADTPSGRQLDLKSGAELVLTADDLREIRRRAGGGDVWLLSDWPLVAEDNWYLSDAEPALKRLVREWMTPPTLTGRDGRTVAVRLPGGPLTTPLEAHP